MNHYSRDMFREMDEIFSRLVSRMHEEMYSMDMPMGGYRIAFESTVFPPLESPAEEIPSRISHVPVAEVHRIDDEVKVIAELPGAPADSIRLDLKGQRLTIEAGGPDMPYHSTADLPPVDRSSMQQSFRNGVLEVTFKTLPEA
jgi:HSP20 family molecular chaperone IbpA